MRGRLVAPVLVALLVVLSSPFIGELRNLLKSAFPASWTRLVIGVVGLAFAGAFVAAVARIRAHRWRRYGGLALSAALLVFYAARARTGNAEVDAVQLFHFVEYGLVTFLFYRAVRPAGDLSVVLLPLLCGVLVGVFEEWLQWLVPIRTGEIGDVLIDAEAVACGIVFSLALAPPDRLSLRLPAESRRRVLDVAAAMVLVVAGFIHCAHLGYAIHDAEIGRFRSYFTADTLLRLGPARAGSWRAHPPERLPILGIEDYYMTEAGWHVQRRNTAYTAHDFQTAWRENRILEKYFDPFLDIKSFIGHERHRWAPAQREEVEAGRGPAPPGAWVSRAGEGRIWVRPTKRELWLVALTLAAVLLAASRVRRRRAAR